MQMLRDREKLQKQSISEYSVLDTVFVRKKHIDETIDFIKKLSFYPFAFYFIVRDEGIEISNIYSENTEVSQKLLLEHGQSFFSAPEIHYDSLIYKTLHHFISESLQQQIHSISMLCLESKELNGQVCIVLYSDIEHQVCIRTWKILEQYIQQRQDALDNLLKQSHLQHKIESTEILNLGLTKYFSVIAHDLRAPFHGILGCADILAHERHTLDVDAAQRLADYIYDTSQTTYGLLENLLNWAMAEGGRFHQTPTHFKLDEAIQFVQCLLKAFAFKKQITLDLEVEQDLIVYADKNMMVSVIQNLCANALKFTAANEKKTIKISAYKNKEWGEIKIIDQGIGMTEIQISKLFGSYAIPSTQGTSGEKGTGLGLMLCKRFIELNHGEIVVESSLGHGTTFLIRIPLDMTESDKNSI